MYYKLRVLVSTRSSNKKRQLNILLAEDEDIYQQIIESYIESLGLKITIVEDGKKCLAEAADHTYDIILMDIEMPEKNGLEATREIREKGIKTPIIAVTSNTWREDEITSKESGMNDFIAKPLTRSTLEKAINFWADHNQSLT
jgi:CheY-like chemotaxis protein